MTPSYTSTISISQVAELLASNGYDVSESAPGLLTVKDVHSKVSFQAALEGNVLFMTVNLMTLPKSAVTADLMRRMLAADNGISTSAFRLIESSEGKTMVTLNNFCKLQDLQAEDQDDILSLASYLMVDVIEARDLLAPVAAV